MHSTTARQLVLTFVPSMAVLAAVVAVRVVYHVAVPDMTRDVTTIANIHPLTGVLSNLCALAWCASACITGFAAATLRTHGSRDAFRFLLSSALLSTYLLVDDFFLVHDELVPRYLGIHENFVYAALGLSVAAYLFTFRRMILRSHFEMLALAVGLLAASVTIDAVLDPILRQYGLGVFIWEDGAKWLGIAAWCSYHIRTSHELLAGSIIRPHTVE